MKKFFLFIKSNYNKYKKLFNILFFGFGLGMALLLYFIFESYYMFPKLSKKQNIIKKTPELILLDINNYPIEYSIKSKKINIIYEDIPDLLIQGLVSVEDPSFFSHRGISIFSTLRSILLLPFFILLKQRPWGASTITQQLVRNLFLTFRYSYVRKIREVILSFRIERELSKKEILVLYLNNIYFGKGIYGIGTAAKTLFNKSLKQLTINEIAYLIGIIKNPNFSSNKYYEQALIRKNHVLNIMVQNNLIKQDNFEYLQFEDVKFYKSGGNDKALIARYFIDYTMENIKPFIENKYIEGDVFIGTTLHLPTQKILEEAIAKHISQINNKMFTWYGTIASLSNDQLDSWETKDFLKELNKYYNPTLYGCNIKPGLMTASNKVLLNNGKVVLLDNYDVYKDYLNIGSIFMVEQKQDKFFAYQKPQIETTAIVLNGLGQMLAVNGGNDYSISSFNRMNTLIQWGSLSKVIILYFLLENGYKVDDIVKDEKVEIPLTMGQIWTPKNWDDKFKGPISLLNNFILSRNCGTIWAVIQIDNWELKLKQFFKKLGVPNFKPSFILGSNESNISKLGLIFTSFINGGFKVSKIKTITYIEDENKTIFKDKLNNEIQIFNPEISDKVFEIFQENTKRGLSASLKINPEWAVKTGTVNQKRRFLFVAFHKPNENYPHGIIVLVTVSADNNIPLDGIANRSAGFIAKEIIEKIENAKIKYPNNSKKLKNNDIKNNDIIIESNIEKTIEKNQENTDSNNNSSDNNSNQSHLNDHNKSSNLNNDKPSNINHQ